MDIYSCPFFLKILESNISIILHFMDLYNCPLFFDLWRYYMPIFRQKVDWLCAHDFGFYGKVRSP